MRAQPKDDEQFICPGPVCRCNGGRSACSCVVNKTAATCRSCRSPMVVINVNTGKRVHRGRAA